MIMMVLKANTGRNTVPTTKPSTCNYGDWYGSDKVFIRH